MSQKINIRESLLRNLYIQKGLSSYQIAKKFRCWNTTILNRLREYGIQIKNPKKPLYPDRSKLHELYITKQLSPYVIAKKLKCNPTTIRNWLIQYGFKIRKKRLINIDKKELFDLYHNKRWSLKKIGDLFGFTPSGLFGVFKRLGIKKRNYSESSKYYFHRHDFIGPKSLKAYIIGFRLGDLHVRKGSDTIRIGCGTTKLEQVKLITSLFGRYGVVYVGNRDKKGAWHPEASLNNSFSFLLPKHDKIPVWIKSSKVNFLNFFAGYTDAEGNIGCYPRARLKITSYDYGILKDIGRGLKKYLNVFPVFFLEKTNRETHNKDALSLTINERQQLLTTLNFLKPLLKHEKRKNNTDSAIQNIISRLNNYKWQTSFT